MENDDQKPDAPAEPAGDQPAAIISESLRMRLLERIGEWIIPKVKGLVPMLVNRYFFDESLVYEMLYTRDIGKVPPSNWIDYKLDSHYYAGQVRHVEVSRAGRHKPLQLPYSEVINFTAHPDTKITVRAEIKPYQMTKCLEERTDEIVRRFTAEKGKTFNGPILRVKSLLKNKRGAGWRATLERARYFDQVRTNLSLDAELLPPGKRTLRLQDLGPDNSLRPFDESHMVNSIGVSAVCFFLGKNRRKQFFMKLRCRSDGVFEDMLATTSGVVEPPLTDDEAKHRDEHSKPVENHQISRLTELVSYATEEMLREFQRETGLERSHVKSIAPLAFVRELTRGGKPQFFFLIEIQPIRERDFKRRFQSSAEGLEEFRDNWQSDLIAHSKPFSPEFAANLVYPIEHFQARDGKKSSPLFLD